MPREFAEAIVGGPGVARIVTADREPTAALEFGGKLRKAYAEIGFENVVHVEAGEIREPPGDLGFFRLAQGIALDQRRGVFGRGELARFFRNGARSPGRFFSVL